MTGRKYIVHTILLLAVAVLLNLPAPVALRLEAGARDNVAPFQNVLRLLVERVRVFFGFVLDAERAAGQRRDMIVEIANLREELRRLKARDEENAELRKQLGFARASAHKLLLCEVIARGDTSGWWQTIRVNRGTDDGMRPNLAVVTVDGLVGKTMAVSRGTSDVLLITDANLQVACRFAGTTAYGILRGAGVSITGDARLEILHAVEPCWMDFIPKDKKIADGAEVLTSGLGGVFPAGLPVGRVESVALAPSPLYQRARVTPAARLDRLRYVFVVVE